MKKTVFPDRFSPSDEMVHFVIWNCTAINQLYHLTVIETFIIIHTTPRVGVLHYRFVIINSMINQNMN